jgi:hypothetical protein
LLFPGLASFRIFALLANGTVLLAIHSARFANLHCLGMEGIPENGVLN